ncbi:T-cell-specific guanine nucleotide triphosphate-binding protein 2-like [Tachyglossus aculeatus]|uniref:T-cell-specific guanine nucleotide triphosphate-binding protein 2-like n=1 Tax=Tachyglossus aculeatus TaxID=9261 RepID=UPI0018F4AEE1|nr:T-cell-specific guanine nucleotide triphosphate-binding protein 2-like [Tachyglossus aculeatus]
MGKRFYFIRTKVDADLKNSRRSRPDSFNEEQVLKQIRDDCQQCLEKEGQKNPQVFLISNFYLSLFDFPKLTEYMCIDLPLDKSHALVLAMPDITEKAIEMKKTALQETIELESLRSILQDPPTERTAKLQECLDHYRSIFRVNDEFLQKLEEEIKIPLKKLKDLSKSSDFLKLFKNHPPVEMKAMKTPFHSDPELGKSFSENLAIRLHFLDGVVKDAKKILKKAGDPPEKNASMMERVTKLLK